MKERDIQTEFRNYLEENPPVKATIYELKKENGPSMSFSKVADHQIKALLKAKREGIFHKLTDMPHFQGAKSRFDAKKPFDCFYIPKASAFVGICFYRPRRQRDLILIDIEDFVREMKTAKRKSITLTRALEISREVVTIWKPKRLARTHVKASSDSAGGGEVAKMALLSFDMFST